MSNLAPGGKSGKAARRLPDGAKEVLQEFVVDVLRKKIEKDKFVSFAADWFRTHNDKDREKNKGKDGQREFPVTPSNMGGSSWVAAEPSYMRVPQQNVDNSPSSQNTDLPDTGGSTLAAPQTEFLSPSYQNLSPNSAVSLAPTEAQGSSQNLDVMGPQPESRMDLGSTESSSAGAAASRRQGVSAESYDPSAPNEASVDKSFPKSEEQLARVRDAVKEVLLFRSLDDDQLNKVIDALEEYPVTEGTDVITIGDEIAEHFYVIDSGDYECFALVHGRPGKVHEYNGQGSFGELALMYNQPRAATVTAKTAGMLWRLDRETFRKIVLRGAFMKRELYKQLMDRVDFLADLQPYEKENICDALQPITFNTGDVVMTQGETGDGMYFVEAGEVVCVRTDSNQEQKEIARVGPGEYVGELALIAGQPRAATVTAAVDGTKLAFLDARAFERLMGPCVEILKKNMDRYKDRIVAVFGENAEL